MNSPRHTIKLTRIHFAVLLTLGLLLCLTGVWSFFVGRGKNGFDALPLIWYLVLVLVPLLGIACFVAMWRVRAGSNLWLIAGALLLIPQLLVWSKAMRGILHYLFQGF
jgi:hypothetical protein